MRPNVYIYLIIKFKAIIAVKNDNTIVTETAKKLILFSSKILGEMKNPDNIIVGMDINNDILIESYLQYPKILNPVIVIPDLETPGIRAKA